MIGRWIDPLCRKLALPLFARELTEASSRRRTYVVRALYAGLLFILANIFAREVLFPSGNRFNVLGRGDELFRTVVMTQFWGIYLFLPAMTCSSITGEKERNTLGLLFLTRLTPTKIILEKFLSRVFPMISLLLLSLPLFGIAYTLGGLEAGLIWQGTLNLLARTLMVGAVGIAASAWCHTTAGAFFMTYALLLVLFPFTSSVGVGPTPALVVSVFSLIAARVILIRRATSTPKHYGIRLLRWIDATAREINDRYAHGIEIIKSGDVPLKDDPIAWRETTKSPLGALRYLVRILLAIEIPVLIIGLSAVGGRSSNLLEGLYAVTGFLWFAACLLIAVKGSLLFPVERSRQTLGVLLTTTTSTRSLLRQKLAGLWRLIAVCAVPPVTLFWMITYLSNAMERLTWTEMVAAFTAMFCVMATTFAAVGYLSLLIGLRIPRVSRAVLTSVSVFVVACLVGPILYMVFDGPDPGEPLATGSLFSLYSPLATLGEAMAIPEQAWQSLLLISGTLLVYGGLAFLFRNVCYRNAANLLGRGDEIAPPRLIAKQLELTRRAPQPEKVAG